MSDNGWIKLHRKCLDSDILKNHKLWVFWCYCLMKATHKEYNQTVGFQEVNLQPGQFVFGRKKASKDLSLSEQTVRTCINHLVKSEKITIRPTNKFSVINIVNWAIYQQDEKQNNQQTNQQVTNNQPTSNHKQEHKKYSAKLYQFVTTYQNYVFETFGHPKVTDTLINNACDTIDKIKRIDGHDPTLIKDVIEWSKNDEFWSIQVKSLASLRNKKKNGLKKFENLLTAYQNDPDNKLPAVKIIEFPHLPTE